MSGMTVATHQPVSAYRGSRAVWTLVAGVLLGAFAIVHAIWTGFHAPLAAWIAPLSIALIGAGSWSLGTHRALPRWATVTLCVLATVFTLLVLVNVVYALTLRPHVD